MPPTERHLKTQLDELQRRYDTLTRRIAALDTDIGREIDSERKLTLKERRAEAMAERDQIAADMAGIEQQFAASGSAIAQDAATIPAQTAPIAPASPEDHASLSDSDGGKDSSSGSSPAAPLPQPPTWRRSGWPTFIWAIIGALLVAAVGTLFFSQARCLIEYRLTEAVVGLIVFLAGGASLVFTSLVLPGVRRALQAFYGGTAITLLSLVLLIMLQPALNPESCQPKSSPTPTSSPIETATPPSPVTVAEAIFFDDFEKTRYWTEGTDTNGRSWYGDGGYHVVSQSSVSGWVWVLSEGKPANALPIRRFTDAVIEVDAMPVSDGRVTGYGVVFCWEKGNNYYLFQVRPPAGRCGFQKIQTQAVADTFLDWTCPPPTKDNTARVRLEIKQGRVRAFIDGEYIGEHSFPDYKGGLLGFETYNGGTAESKIAAEVKFDNLVVWDYPD